MKNSVALSLKIKYVIEKKIEEEKEKWRKDYTINMFNGFFGYLNEQINAKE